MTKTQKLQARKRELQNKLQGYVDRYASDPTQSVDDAVKAMTKEQRGEIAGVQTQLQDVDMLLDAAIKAEDLDRRQRGQQFNHDGESAEVREIRDRASVVEYTTSAINGVGLRGAPAELNAALDIPLAGNDGNCMPWVMLVEDTPVPMNVFTDTGDLAGPVVQRSILQRLFGPGLFDILGVRIDTVPAGRAEWPLLTGGVAPAMKAEGSAAAAAVAASFGTEALKPKRLTGKYEFTHEQAAQVPGIEEALRRDLADAVKAKMSDLLLNGNETTNAQDPDGFFHTINAPNNPGNVVDFGGVAGAAARGVDGIHASMEGEVNVLIGTKTYEKGASLYANSDSKAAIQALKERCMQCMATSYIAAPTGNIQQALLHAAGPNGGSMRGDSIAAVWNTGLQLIRDPYTKASQGVVLTWVTLWDAQTAFRAGAYKRVAFKLA